MTDLRKMRFCRSASAWGLLSSFGLVLCSCAVSSPLVVRSSVGLAVAPDAQIAIAPPEEGSAPRSRQFAAALIAALQARGMDVSPEGQLIADYAVSVGPAAIGVQQTGGSQDAQSAQPEWIAAPRPRRRFDACDAQRLHGTLMLIDRLTGATLYRGQGAATECEFGEDKIRELAEKLVADFAARR